MILYEKENYISQKLFADVNTHMGLKIFYEANILITQYGAGYFDVIRDVKGMGIHMIGSNWV